MLFFSFWLLPIIYQYYSDRLIERYHIYIENNAINKLYILSVRTLAEGHKKEKKGGEGGDQL